MPREDAPHYGASPARFAGVKTFAHCPRVDVDIAVLGIPVSGYDVVEAGPPDDGPGQPTAVASVVFEFLTMDVLAHANTE